MAPERVILCGAAPARGLPDRRVDLDIYGPDANIRLRLEEVRRGLWGDIPAVLRDLLDLAAYVYTADQAVTRANGGRLDGETLGAGWRRAFRFRVPVREPDRWNSCPVRAALVAVLSFLSEDEYEFEFVPLRRDKSLDGFIDFDATPFDGVVEEVVMFSGGLDSLAGAVEEVVRGRRTPLLVHHRSHEKLTPRHDALVRRLGERAGRRPLHLPVRLNKAKRLGREPTQRTRSFLFAALGAVFARTGGLGRVRFYENGVTSLNLPPSPQVVGARASRTTHPRVLAGFGRLFTALFGEPFAVENPFRWDTKTDVVGRIAAAGCGDLIGLSTSCANPRALRSRTHSHCGVCSQCVDRRFAVLATGREADDPAAGYAVDLLTGPRGPGDEQAMLSAYLDLTQRVHRMGEDEFREGFGEVTRALAHLDLPPRAGMARVFELHKRHARQVTGVITAAIQANAEAVGARLLPPTCLLRLVYAGGDAGASGPPDTPPPPGANYVVRRGPCWALRFGGGPEIPYPESRGLDYLRVLLATPGVSFTAADLSARVRPAPAGVRAVTAAAAAEAGSGHGGAAGEEALDDRGRAALNARLSRIAVERGLAEASDSPTRLDEVEELDAEERQIRDRLRRDHGRGGRPRKLSDPRDQDRNRVCNPIRRVLDQIRLYDEALAAHLTPALCLGHTIGYHPPAGVTWEVGD